MPEENKGTFLERHGRKIANGLSIARLAGSAVLAHELQKERDRGGRGNIKMAAFVGALLVTDAVDGYVARKSKQPSKGQFGPWIDQISDKAVTHVVHHHNAATERMPKWQWGVELGRDLLVTGHRVYQQLTDQKTDANTWGKRKMMVGSAHLIASTLGLPNPIDTLERATIGPLNTVLSVASGAERMLVPRAEIITLPEPPKQEAAA